MVSTVDQAHMLRIITAHFAIEEYESEIASIQRKIEELRLESSEAAEALAHLRPAGDEVFKVFATLDAVLMLYGSGITRVYDSDLVAISTEEGQEACKSID